MPSFEIAPEPTLAEFVFERRDPTLGSFRLRALAMPHDMAFVHSWVTHERARYWGMQGQSLEEVTLAYAKLCEGCDVFVGYHERKPAFLVERYRPEHDAIGRHYAVEEGDRGMHVLLAPPAPARHGFSWAVFRTVMEFMFEDASVRRVVVEPDVRNVKIHALNRRAGFKYDKLVALPNKLAHLAFCTREDHRLSEQGARPSNARLERVDSVCWQEVNRELVRKFIAELAHELVLCPKLEHERGGNEYSLHSDASGVTYHFIARRLPLDHWDIASGSIRRMRERESLPVDAVDFAIDFRDALAVPKERFLDYLEEIGNTLFAAANKRSYERSSAHDLVHADFQEIEAAMTEGHPAFIANSGRVGFDIRDYLSYAPEVAPEVRLVWLAARRDRSEFNALDDLSYETLMEEELGSEMLEQFRLALSQRRLELADYRLMPVHPWQWSNKIALSFSADLASADLVYLGQSEDRYRPQQSLRTLYNRSHPHKRYVKTALSVLNMGFFRGLSLEYMRTTPAINAHLHRMVAGDPFFGSKGFKLLREVATVGYRQPEFDALPSSSPQRKMLAALWRESPPLPRGAEGRLMTMAALLHRDVAGRALLPLLIAASGLSIDAWLGRYLDCYLAPLLHAFYAHRLAFMPHGENVILELSNHVVVGAFIKDIAEEAVIMDSRHVAPPVAQRVVVDVPKPLQVLSIFTDVFDGVFRYIAQILNEQADYAPIRFWARVRDAIEAYQASRPELCERFRAHDLFVSNFARSCLNRLQFRNNRQLVDLSDPACSLQFAGTLQNPIAS